MFCTVCGHQLTETDKFCPQCGEQTDKTVPPATAQSSSNKKLVRPMHKKSIGGVCAGFADYLDVDLTLMRIVWLCAAIFTGGIGFVAYLVCWMIMPKDYGPPVGEPAPAASQTTASAD